MSDNPHLACPYTDCASSDAFNWSDDGVKTKEVKQCTKCAEVKGLSEFSPDRRKKDGRQARCKACNNLAKIVRYAKSPEVRLAKKLYDVRYVNKNRARKNQSVNAWNAANRDRARAKSNKWKSENRHKVASYTRKRQAAKLKRTPAWLTPDQLGQIEQLYWLAADLKCVSGQVYHVDHIIPLQGKDICGLHVPWNLQVLPSDVNERKLNHYEQSHASTLSLP